MGKLYDNVMLSHESLAQSYRAYLLSIGITHDKNGTSIDDLDYYSIRQLVAIQTEINNPENSMF